MSFFNTAIRKKDVFMALPYYRGPALAEAFILFLPFAQDRYACIRSESSRFSA